MVKTRTFPASVGVPSRVNADDEAWGIEVVHIPHHRRARIVYKPKSLERALDGAPARPSRGPAHESQSIVLLSDIFFMGPDSFVIEAQLLQLGHKRQALQMHLIAPNTADANPHVRLRWGSQAYSAKFRGGQATIDHLPPLYPKPKNAPPPEFNLVLDFDGDGKSGDTA